MKVKLSTEFKREYDNFRRELLKVRNKKSMAAYVLTTGSSAREKIGSKSRSITRTSSENLKIITDLAIGSPSKGSYMKKRNPIFLSQAEIKASINKGVKILGSSLDLNKNYKQLLVFFADRMNYYINKHIKDGTMENGPVAPLKERYARLKKYLYGDVPILVRTGALKKSLKVKVK